MGYTATIQARCKCLRRVPGAARTASVGREVDLRERNRLWTQVALQMTPVVLPKLGLGWLGWRREVLSKKLILLNQTPANDLVVRIEAELQRLAVRDLLF